MEQVDVFLSWTRADGDDRVRAFAAALVAAGVSVWIDEERIEPFESISAGVRDGLASAKVLLAWYSRRYPTRRACREELTTALLAGDRAGEGFRRVLVINPEDDVAHLLEPAVLDRRFAGPAELADLPALARKVKRVVDDVDGPLGSLPDPGPARWYGGDAWRSGSRRFVGRFTELWQVHDRLTRRTSITGPGAGGRGVVVVAGPGGVGKSLLAAEYATLFAPCYPGGVVWLSALGNADRDTEAGADEQFEQLARWLELEPAGGDAVRRQVATELDRRGEPVLWVVDDLPSGLTSAELEQWRCPAGCVAELITTRDQAHGSLDTVVLDVLREEEAVSLLTHDLSLGAEEMREAGWLAGELGYHPMACDVAGRYVSGRTTFAEYRRLISAELGRFDELAGLLSEQLPGGHSRQIVTTLATSLLSLGPDAWWLLRIARRLAPVAIPRRILRDALVCLQLGEMGVEDAWPADLDELPETTGRYARLSIERALTDQHRDGLWQFDRTSHTISVHSLVRAAAELVDPVPDTHGRVFAAAAAAIADAVSEGAEDADWSSSLAHARHLTDRVNYDELTSSATLLLLFLAQADLESGRPGRAADRAERAFRWQKEFLGPDAGPTLQTANFLGIAWNQAGNRAAAEKLHEQVYRIRREQSGDRDGDSLVSLFNLATASLRSGDPARALELHRQAYEGMSEVFGPDDGHTVMAGTGIGLALMRLGRHTEALAHLRDLRDRHADGADVAGREILRIDATIGVVLHDMEDLEAALTQFRRTHATLLRVLGETHEDTIVCADNLAKVHYDRGEPERARELVRQTHSSRDATLTDFDPGYAPSPGHVAVAFADFGDTGALRELYEQRGAELGEDHPITRVTGKLLIDTLERLGDEEGAMAVHRHLFKVFAASGAIEGDLSEEEIDLMIQTVRSIRDHPMPPTMLFDEGPAPRRPWWRRWLPARRRR